MALQDLIRWLLPRESHFYRYLEKQAVIVHQGARAFGEFKDGRPISEVNTAVQALEHEGDRVVHEMEEALGRTFVTPIDREDLQRLSTELDDIIDLTNSAARACVLLGVSKPTPPMSELINILIECARLLEAALPKLATHDYPGLMAASRAVRQLEKDADSIFRQAVSRLFHDPSIDAKVLMREKEVLEDLEHAIDRCERVANTLANLSVKHG